jgi:hypothetical protein
LVGGGKGDKGTLSKTITYFIGQDNLAKEKVWSVENVKKRRGQVHTFARMCFPNNFPKNALHPMTG